MCFGIPMRVLRVDGLSALCEGHGRREQVDLSLIGRVEINTQVLVHLGNAYRALSDDEAAGITNAISAVAAAANGQPFEHLIADLTDREPQLPPHLQDQLPSKETP